MDNVAASQIVSPSRMLSRPSVSLSHGWIGFFDILGYSSISNSEDLERAAALVRSLLTPRRVQGIAKKTAVDFFGPGVEVGFSDFRWKIFADTILFAGELATPEQVDNEPGLRGANEACTTVFLIMCQTLLLDFFESGLPLRGAIAAGKFYLPERSMSFIGRPISEAHELEVQQRWSGCSFAGSGKRLIEGFWTINPNLFWKVLSRGTIPLKSGMLHDQLALNWCYPTSHRLRRLHDCSIAHIRSRFAAHAKRIEHPNVIQMIENTTIFANQMERHLPSISS